MSCLLFPCSHYPYVGIGLYCSFVPLSFDYWHSITLVVSQPPRISIFWLSLRTPLSNVLRQSVKRLTRQLQSLHGISSPCRLNWAGSCRFVFGWWCSAIKSFGIRSQHLACDCSKLWHLECEKLYAAPKGLVFYPSTHLLFCWFSRSPDVNGHGGVLSASDFTVLGTVALSKIAQSWLRMHLTDHFSLYYALLDPTPQRRCREPGVKHCTVGRRCYPWSAIHIGL